MNNKYVIQRLILVCVFLIPSISYSGGMESQMDRVYLEMENYSKPGSFETQRRSGYTGGRYTMKSQIVNENLVSFAAPSARGGCGGIDVFGGSFSFVNSDQIVQLLRAVASNAKGYAFQLAMDNVCPDCMKWMNELQSKVQNLNSNMSNSCQLAQGLVNSAVNKTGLDVKEQTEHTLESTFEGIGEDFTDLKTHIGSSQTAIKQRFNAQPDAVDDKSGAVVYKALKAQNVASWFTGGDELLLETIMTMTGSFVVGGIEQGANGQGDTTKKWVLPGNELRIIDLIEGITGAKIYDCSRDTITDHCRIAQTNTKSVDIRGIKERLLETFTGPTGVITRIKNKNLNATLTNEQKGVLASMPSSIGSKIFEITPLSPGAAEEIVLQTIDAVALEYVYALVKTSFSATKKALYDSKDPYLPLNEEQLKVSKAALEEEYSILSDKYGSLNDINDHYNKLLKNIQKPKYIDADTQKGNKPG